MAGFPDDIPVGFGGVGGDGENAAGGHDGEEVAGALSCKGLETRCGAALADDCCRASFVEGGSFFLTARTQPTPTDPTTVSAFYLDRYEVTVGRFEKFIDDYDGFRASGMPSQDAGEHPRIPRSGWQSVPFDARLPASAAELRQAVASCGWQTLGAPNASLPLNCVGWYEAFAFCLWDGGRLPTHAEWEYAAVGGNESRTAPWGVSAPDNQLVVAECMGDYYAGCSFSDIRPVGSRPDGAGRWGQQDLLGSLYEWTLDAPGNFPSTCNDCAILWYDSAEADYRRTFRGGSWARAANWPLYRTDYECCLENPRSSEIGFRCARNEPVPVAAH